MVCNQVPPRPVLRSFAETDSPESEPPAHPDGPCASSRQVSATLDEVGASLAPTIPPGTCCTESACMF